MTHEDFSLVDSNHPSVTPFTEALSRQDMQAVLVRERSTPTNPVENGVIDFTKAPDLFGQQAETRPDRNNRVGSGEELYRVYSRDRQSWTEAPASSFERAAQLGETRELGDLLQDFNPSERMAFLQRLTEINRNRISANNPNDPSLMMDFTYSEDMQNIGLTVRELPRRPMFMFGAKPADPREFRYNVLENGRNVGQ
ncbi:MAG: hypothetical protein JST01_21465 [Cyanobacteria bacterium SZAS TMP-1]|nr:hypothetical protein [Cyanobacteria bacterium SZAS TMP-1]